MLLVYNQANTSNLAHQHRDVCNMCIMQVLRAKTASQWNLWRICALWSSPTLLLFRIIKLHHNAANGESANRKKALNYVLFSFLQVMSSINLWVESWRAQEKLRFLGLPHLAEPPAPPVPHNQPPQVVSGWLSSHYWTLTWGPEPHRSPMLTRNCLLLFLWILIDEGSVFSSRPPSPLLGQSRTGREHVKKSGGPMRNGATGFQRVKRGWVWNQFFVLEEYMGSEPQYVGKVKKKKKSFCFQFFMVQEES